MKRIINFTSLLFFVFFLAINIDAQAQNSSEKAKEIALKVMESMGGIENYNNIHYIQWDFGKRTLYWDKWTGNVRVEFPEKELVVLVNIHTTKGKVYQKGELITNKQKVNKLLEQGKKWWINDSYWLIMPWKLLDPGVNLTYVKTESLANGNKADVLQMTFEKVGVTPNNKYWVYVDTQDHLIKQWAFYKNFNDETPKFIKPWDHYQKLENVLFSYNRSDFGPKNVVITSSIKENLFTEL